MNPRFNEQISPVPWHLVRLRFHCTRLGIHWKGQQVPRHSFVCLYAEKPLKRKRNVCEQTRFQTRSGIVPCPTVVLQPFKTYFLGPSSSQLFVIGLCTIIFCFCLFLQPILYGFVQVVTSPNLCQTWVKYSLHKKWSLEVTDPDLQIRRGAVIHTLR